MVARQHYRWDFIGLSTDNKPTPATSEKVVDGSTFYCSDNSKLYVWYNDQWYEKVVSGGGGGGGTDNFNALNNRPKYNGSLMTGDTDIPEVITYSNFTGTDGSSAGTAGLVPAPATTDAGKYLKSDGTWSEVQGGGGSYTAGDGIDITNDVISATNTGKARVLTTDDYNWPANNPDGIAVYKLESGIYTNKNGLKVYYHSGAYDTDVVTIIVSKYPDGPKPAVIYKIPVGGMQTYLYRTMDNGTASGSAAEVITSQVVQNNLTSTNTSFPLSAAQGKVLKDLVDSLAIRGAGAPTTSTVGQVGTLYEDTTNGDLYICTDATNPYVWEALGGGGGGSITPVQVPGNSTTDVMSQNAVTSMVFTDPSARTKVRIGNYAGVYGDYGVAIGYQADQNSNYSVALGSYSRSTQKGEVAISSSSLGTNGYNNSRYRLLTGLYDGQDAHDAATVGQITPTTDSSAPTTSTAGRLGEIRIDTTTNTAYMCVLSDSTTPAYEWKQITA
jgi:hypothetical protein